ncbi:HHR212Cp [Eremothecium sinecaudum]|uniref:HHR212Cp n=1 Tax=Eremothecium sinecaudum TaxID=45286 RepID=A0A120K2Y5_9SACH|nr:HHR212Cp [Eremothecium sinecaudum]AMD22981.1 HHR212Cp [Eremothecium sinecaudum]
MGDSKVERNIMTLNAKKHLFVLIHGLWGNHTNMISIKNTLEMAFSTSTDYKDENVYFIPQGMGYFKTLHGIEVVGYHLIIELLDFMTLYGIEKFDRISFIGYSMGGLVSRFMIGVMFSECREIFRHLKPTIYMTFATPHLGVQYYFPKDRTHPAKKAALSFMDIIGPHLSGQSGRQLFLKNEDDDTLVRLTEAHFLETLGQFKYRICIANVRNDFTVAFYTSYITNYDPFIETDNKIKYTFEKALPTDGILERSPLIVDMKMLDPKQEKPKVKRPWYAALTRMTIMVLIFLIIFPVFFVSIAGSIYSYTVTTLLHNNITRGEILPTIRSKLSKRNTISDVEENKVDEKIILNTQSTPSTASDKDHTTWEQFIRKYSTDQIPLEHFPKLPFDSKRTTMVQNLNKLSWIRIPIYIKAPNAHEGIIARNGLTRSHFTSSAGLQFAAQLVHYLVYRSDEK